MCATENPYTPARLEAKFKLLVVFILSHHVHLIRTIRTMSYHLCHLGFAPNSLRVYPQDVFLLVCAHKPVISFETLFISFELSSIFLLALGSVGIRLVHANVNLFSFI